MSVATRIVRIAAGSLPKSLRDRYREQWLADIRDASEQNLRPEQIALGSVAFAVTVRRPFPKRRELTSAGVERHARIALGVAASGAALGPSQYASMFAGEYLGDGRVPDTSTIVMSTSLIAYSVLASLIALILVLATRGTSTRTRWAVVLFAAASASPIVQSSLNAAANASWEPALHASAVPYLAALIAVVVGLWLVRMPRRIENHNPRASIVAAAVVLLVAAATLGDAMILWSLRAPLLFAAGARSASNPAYIEWLRLKAQGENLTSAVFFWWGAGAITFVAVMFVVTLVAQLAPRHALFLMVAAAGVILLAGGGLLGFLQDAEPGIVPLAETSLVLWLGRLALLAAILSLSNPGGSSRARRASHRVASR